MARIIIVYMKDDLMTAGTLRLIQAPPGTTVEIRDYEHALCDGRDEKEDVWHKRDEQGEPYEEHILERPGPSGTSAEEVASTDTGGSGT